MSDIILSVGIVALNEQENLPVLLQQLLNQSYEKSKTELLLIDSGSCDDTRNIFESFKRQNELYYYNIAVLDNPRRIQAAGWNVAIDSFKGDALLRLDAHARVTDNFLEAVVSCLESGEMVCGGKRPNLSPDNSAVSRLVTTADRSVFGGSFGKYHDTDGKKYVDTVFHGCYRREVIEKVGHFNEALGRTEDNDFHQRIRAAGYKICYDPAICSFQFSRPNVLGSVKQKYGNGFWIGRTLAVNPKCISLFHLAPFAFVAALVATLVLGLFCSFLPFAALWIIYAAADILLSVLTIASEKPFSSVLLLLPFMFAALHLAYGVGALFGICSILSNNPKKQLHDN